jgi:formate dehydrogenase iron-sulfur subunit
VEKCPFKIPQFNKKTNKSFKCNMCAHRTGQGIQPACVEACFTNAMKFGEFDTIAAEARNLAAREKLYLYGDKEAGGTSLFILTRNDPAKVGYQTVPFELSFPKAP